MFYKIKIEDKGWKQKEYKCNKKRIAPKQRKKERKKERKKKRKDEMQRKKERKYHENKNRG